MLDHKTQPIVAESEAASLLDIGDGALYLELHSKGNSIGEAAMDMLQRGLGTPEGGSWKGTRSDHTEQDARCASQEQWELPDEGLTPSWP